MTEVYLHPDIHNNIKEFNKLDLKLNRSPSDNYFSNIFNKICSKECLDITTNLLEKILIKYNIIIDVKSFLYAYVIIINHHEIFGFNTKLEHILIKNALNMLYTFSKLCDHIYRKRYRHIESLIMAFIDKYKLYMKQYQEWSSKEREELISVLIYTYHLSKCHNQQLKDDKEIKEIKEIGTKLQYLMFDNKLDVGKYINSRVDDKYLNMSYNIMKKYHWNILLYNLENHIQLNANIRSILQIIQNICPECNKDSHISIYLKYIGDMSLDYEIFGNKYFFNLIYYLITLQVSIDRDDHEHLTEFQTEVEKQICYKKYKHFAHKLLRKDYSHVIPKFFQEFGKDILFAS